MADVDAHDTPPPRRVWELFADLERRLSELRRSVDGLVGVDGDRGRVGRLEADMRAMTDTMDDLKSVTARLDKAWWKLAITFAGAGALGGGVIVAVIMKLVK